MKKVFFITLLFTSITHASGKLMVQGNFFDNGKTPKPMVGLSVYETLGKYLAINGWVGAGSQPLETKDDVNWLVSKIELDLRMKKFVVAPGIQYKELLSSNENDTIPYIKLTYDLW
jgi:hypothetical protein